MRRFLIGTFSFYPSGFVSSALNDLFILSLWTQNPHPLKNFWSDRWAQSKLGCCHWHKPVDRRLVLQTLVRSYEVTPHQLLSTQNSKQEHLQNVLRRVVQSRFEQPLLLSDGFKNSVLGTLLWRPRRTRLGPRRTRLGPLCNLRSVRAQGVCEGWVSATTTFYFFYQSDQWVLGAFCRSRGLSRTNSHVESNVATKNKKGGQSKSFNTGCFFCDRDQIRDVDLSSWTGWSFWAHWRKNTRGGK